VSSNKLRKIMGTVKPAKIWDSGEEDDRFQRAEEYAVS
jgi:hypothetical protein